MDPDLIDRVEVVRGPSSSIYGNNAFFAVVNVITRKGGTLDAVPAVRAGLEGPLAPGRRLTGSA